MTGDAGSRFPFGADDDGDVTSAADRAVDTSAAGRPLAEVAGTSLQSARRTIRSSIGSNTLSTWRNQTESWHVAQRYHPHTAGD